MDGENFSAEPSEHLPLEFEAVTFGEAKKLFTFLNKQDELLQLELPILESSAPGPLAPIEEQIRYAREVAKHEAKQELLADIRESVD